MYYFSHLKNSIINTKIYENKIDDINKNIIKKLLNVNIFLLFSIP
jgi:uncharacterized protein Yka (UPF0111/DUF47 family)